ncbi:hypothetical protein BGZ61DRAFT_439154 [Ilyonectria robusta]|uniref:uncharacterized protein n=1 Tax=Ilyonectria robusta TaxID=1079257 RepID=UPI001E8D1A9C|nr:uncharacterized protein BGZ61DRAFT_439154 [Ilyonectria robusta]KAH8737874.1 hypothetical protein BGZ61DRAFT_439154 [Ilyonectria robusta]
MATSTAETSGFSLTEPITSDQLTIGALNATMARQLSKAQREAAELFMVEQVFESLEIDMQKYIRSARAALNLIRTTKVLEAYSFSTWEGYWDLEDKVMTFPQNRKVDGDQINMLPAPDMIAIAAAKRIRRLRCTLKDEVTNELEEFNLFDWLPLALEVFQITDKPFQIVKTGHNDRSICKVEGDDYVFFYPDSCPATPAMTATLFDDGPCEIPRTPDHTSEVGYTINRQQVMAAGSGTLHKLGKRKFHQGALKEEILDWLDEHKARVLSDEAKDMVYTWGCRFNDTVANWVEQATSDLMEYSYTITKSPSNAEVEQQVTDQTITSITLREHLKLINNIEGEMSYISAKIDSLSENLAENMHHPSKKRHLELSPTKAEHVKVDIQQLVDELMFIKPPGCRVLQKFEAVIGHFDPDCMNGIEYDQETCRNRHVARILLNGDDSVPTDPK